MEYPVYSVSQVNGHIKDLLDADPALSGLFIRGELSNYKTYPSGHHYFSMKDEGGAIRCVMFRREASALRFRPQNGMKVVAFGRVAVFPRDGQYQLYVSSLTPDGVGDLHVAFEQLKARLAAEGLFDEGHKKPLPRFPARIALVTSPAGAAVRDMLRILNARWPIAEVYVVPCRVQGAEAPAEIAGAIAWVNAQGAADLIITGRGGGSMEDLWCFNDEGVARAIYASRIPVISAVGHEPDVTIADYVADLRAATPSNAAELAVPDQNEQYALLSHLGRRMGKAVERQLQTSRAALDRAGRSRMLRDPMSWVDDRRMLLDRQRDRMAHGLTLSLGTRRADFARLAASLDALSPLKVLGRGYAIAKGPKGVVKSAKDVKPGDPVSLRVADGEIACEVL
ncbi:exodeoxyribonuclease VII large subunit [Pseudoflavonifractor phocaeensis]|uniref:exodeoxyribonuclease VII large subunit n=1 Tax=Pseudoflavonifractor phocaeensis TaxID=1870988 RepID=UPI00313CA5BC